MIYTHRRLVLATFPLALAGCMMGPDYQRPEIPVPQGYTDTVITDESIVNLPWWELFEDERLNALVAQALAQNNDLAVAIARVEEARALLGFVRADQFPEVNAAADARTGNNFLGPAGGGESRDVFILSGDVSFEIDLWGKLRRSTEAARAELLATIEARNVVTTTLIADVANAYLLLLDLENRVEIAQRTLLTRQDSLDIIQARFDQGTVPLIDVNQAQIELADATAELASLIREEQQAENLLNVLLGRNPTPILRQPLAETVLSMPEIPVGLPSDLLQRRPDIRQASQTLAAQTARIGVAEALRFPSLGLTGSFGWASDDLSNVVSGDNEIWDYGASILAPIFNAGRNRSRVEAEEARTEQALNNYEQTVLRAFQEVEDSLVAIRTYRDEIAARQFQVTAARSAASLARARYDGGVSSYLEVLDSERSLFRAELLESSTWREQLSSMVLLYKALGGGWNVAAAEELSEGLPPPRQPDLPTRPAASPQANP